jgi:hypothetical protein
VNLSGDANANTLIFVVGGIAGLWLLKSGIEVAIDLFKAMVTSIQELNRNVATILERLVHHDLMLDQHHERLVRLEDDQRN